MLIFKYDSEKEKMILDIQKEKNRSPETFHMFEGLINDAPIEEGNEFIKKHIEVIKKNWRETKNSFLNNLGKFYEKNLTEPEITCYLTRTAIYPYNYKNDNGKEQWFAAPMFYNPAERNRVIMHELCHYFQPTETPGYFKEAIPVILNDKKVFGSISPDKGHLSDEEEQKWRKIIWDMYSDGKKYGDIVTLLKEDNHNGSTNDI